VLGAKETKGFGDGCKGDEIEVLVARGMGDEGQVVHFRGDGATATVLWSQKEQPFVLSFLQLLQCIPVNQIPKHSSNKPTKGKKPMHSSSDEVCIIKRVKKKEPQGKGVFGQL